MFVNIVIIYPQSIEDRNTPGGVHTWRTCLAYTTAVLDFDSGPIGNQIFFYRPVKIFVSWYVLFNFQRRQAGVLQ